MLSEELRKIIRGEVLDDSDTLDAMSHDASMFVVRPEVVVYPRDAEDVKALVRFVADRKKVFPALSLTPRSAGTDMSGGALGESIVVVFTKYMNRIKAVGEGYAVAEPGVYYRDFERVTLEKGYIFPSYPASREICALGGIVSNNAGGEKTLSYGKTEEYVKKLRAVLADGNEYVLEPLTEEELKKKIAARNFEGEIYRRVYQLIDRNYELLKNAKPKVTKNSAGYYLWNVWNREEGIFDLTKLFVGAQGTLGIITEITLRLVRPKPYSKLLVIFMQDIDKLAPLVMETLKFKPESFESYDDKTLKLVFSYFFDFVKTLGVSNIFKLAWSFLPEAKMVLRGGFPRLILLAEFTGDSRDEVLERAHAAKERLSLFGVSTHLARNETDVRKYWTIRREAFNLLRSHLKAKRSVPIIDDVVVRAEKLTEFLPRLYAILESYKDKMNYAIGGHSGDGNLHIYSIVDMHDEAVLKMIPEVSGKVYDLVLSLGGSITAEHNDGIIRTPYLKKMYGEEVYKFFEETKKIFDPQGIFNPRKKTQGDLNFALEHIRRE